ncbi:Fungal lipase-like domain [Dillenia turbinata]|uniref:Fungal lipase-like domain n=1 Tax=Dillenia turbinata TaxID=194707 RepID=A0AAN8W1B5_9MAGN
MACNGEICSNYLELEPENASFCDLFRLLCIRDSRKVGGYVMYGDWEEEQRKFNYRWLIFISMFVQKCLILFKTPMEIAGFIVEMWLNTLSANGNLILLFFNALTGKIVRPDVSKFTSLIGNLDKRVDLDRKIGHNDSRYNSSLSMMASKLSYESNVFIRNVVQDHWKMEFLGSYKFWNEFQEEDSTQAFLFHDTTSSPDLIVVAFRGTRPFVANDWCTDVDFSWLELKDIGKIHIGFMKALGLTKSRDFPKELKQDSDQHRLAYYAIREMLRVLMHENDKCKIIITGHSLGGALAILFVALLAIHGESSIMERIEGVYTFGQPRVGDEKFGKFMKEKLRGQDVKYLRYVYCNDMVPRMPFDDKTLSFKHFGACLYFNSCYKGKIVAEEPNKNYLSILWFIPKMMNALWELIRSFIIPCTRGPDYKEGWFLKMFRVVGLMIPGLSAHGPQDYDNLTRIGSLRKPHHIGSLNVPHHLRKANNQRDHKFD